MVLNLTKFKFTPSDDTQFGAVQSDNLHSGPVRCFLGLQTDSQGAPGGTRTPNRFLRTELLFH